MFSRVRKRLTFANVTLTLALVFMMTGGAYAAKKYLITSTKQISPAVLKQLQGKAGPGAPGAPGAPGPQGPVGPAGANGKGEQGQKGDQGPAGPTGPAGATGPSGTPGATGPKGATGTPGIPGENGTTGPTGPEGSPWTVGGTLPSGKSEKGTWVVSGNTGERHTTSISFPIPLAGALAEEHVHFIEGKGTGGGCPVGSEAGKPEAEPGNLCVFVDAAFTNNLETAVVVSGENGALGAGVAGAWLLVIPKPIEPPVAMSANGTWAVTAE